MKTFEDSSCFSGWIQYFDNSNNEWRRETDSKINNEYALYSFFKRNGNAFIFEGQYSLEIKKSIKETHEDFILESIDLTNGEW
jgi:hypothetical protein